MDIDDIIPNTRYFIVEQYGFTDITGIIDGTDIAVNRLAEAV